MDRAFFQTECGYRFLGHPLDLELDGRRHPARSDVDRFLEIGTPERIGFVEQGQDLEASVPKQPLDSELRARGELLQKDLGLFGNRADAGHRRLQLLA